MSHLSLSLLGTWHATLDGQPITAFESDKVRALLAYLAVESGRPHRRETLAALLWPERSERNARQNLSQALFNLRKGIGDREANPPFLLFSQQTIQFNRDADFRLDATTFEEQIAATKQHRHEEVAICGLCLKRLDRAISHYQGDFLTGFSLPDSLNFDEWSILKREELQRLILEALAILTEAYEAHGLLDMALPYARRQVELDPWDEEGQHRLLRLLALRGLRNEALAQFESLRQLLQQEFAVEPTVAIRELAEAIRSGKLDREATDLIGEHPRHNLPVHLTPFVGRGSELKRVKGIIEGGDCRLLTLVGPGGIGKTRLAVQVAADLREQYLHGAWFVDLSANTEPAQMLVSVANTFGVPEVAGELRLRTLERTLRQKQLLLLLDNFEHLIDAAPEVGELLSALPGLTVLVTSREVLRLEGEYVYGVPPLSVPEPGSPRPASALTQYDAVRLFLDRMRAADPSFALTEENAPVVAKICAHLEGLPLAIELAAGRSRLFTPEQLLAQLKSRLRTLVGGARNLSHRQKTIRNTIEWSYRLLDEAEQRLLARLGTFVGGWTLEGAEAVCAPGLPLEVINGLESLLDKSLIYQRQPRSGGPRFTMLETIREFAVEKLVEGKEQPEIHRRHAAYILEIVRRLSRQWSKFSYDTVALEVDNVRAIMRRGVASGELATPVEMVCDMYYVWEGRGYAVEMGNWLEGVLANEENKASLPLGLYARALRIAGNLVGMLALDLKKVRRYYEESLMIARAERDKGLEGAALGNLANLESMAGNYKLSQMLNEEALLLHEGQGLRGKVRLVLGNMAENLLEQGSFEAAWLYAERALEMAEERQPEGIVVAIALSTMGKIAMHQDKDEAAREYLERALAILVEQENLYWQMEILALLGALYLRKDDLKTSEGLLLQALHGCVERNFRDRIPTTLDRVAELRFAQGRVEEAVSIYAAVDSFYQRFGLARPPVEVPKMDQNLASARLQLCEEAFALASREGISWDLFDLAGSLLGEQNRGT